jgi:hypothetical protein
MTTTRLSDSDKRQIVDLYRQPGETTLTLAERYGVSNTTISRVLKSSLAAAEYERLIQQKRSLRAAGDTPIQGNVLEAALFALEAAPPILSRTAEPEVSELLTTPTFEAIGTVEAIEEPPIAVARTEKRVLPPPTRKPVEPPVRRSRKPELDLIEASEPFEGELPDLDGSGVRDVTDLEAIRAALQEDPRLSEEDDLEDELEDDLEDDLDVDDDEDDELDGDSAPVMPAIQFSSASAFIKVLPIAEATIPKTCYLVVDRAAELVARPLREFGELGQIPADEIQAKTLPVFDNHRVAKRFSNPRTQRVIKVPDSRVLQKTAPYLQAKGITRLLIEGQVYSL